MMSRRSTAKSAFGALIASATVLPAQAISVFIAAFFARGSTTIDARGRERLSETPLWYRSALNGDRASERFGVSGGPPRPWIHVGGYGADGAHDAENEFLASMRALNARQVLLDVGLPRDFIVVTNYAGRKLFIPQAPPDDPQNRLAYVHFSASQDRPAGGLPPLER